MVTKVFYGRGSVTYSTFDAPSIDVLRLDFHPDSVTAGGHNLNRRNDLNEEGFVLDDRKNILRIRHDQSKDIDIQVDPKSTPKQMMAKPVPTIVNFDNPHVGARVVLHGQYPSGEIDWGEKDWMVYPPHLLMSTFSLGTAAPDATMAELRFLTPRSLMSLDVFNPTDRKSC